MQAILNELILSLQRRSAEYLSSDLGIDSEVQQINSTIFDNSSCVKHSSLIGTTGSVEVFIAIGYDENLFEELVKIFLQGDELEGAELLEIRESISCEIVNIIVGNVIGNSLETSELKITPPLYIEEISSVFRDKNNKVVSTNIKTAYGNMYIFIVRPSKKNIKKRNKKC